MRHRLLALALLGAPVVASAHHGQDFLLIEGPAVPHPGNAYLIADATFALDGDSEERASFAPALLFGASPRVAFELHTHFDDVDGEGWHYEAVAPAVHVLLTDPHKHEGLKVGLSAEYEFGHGEGADTIEARLSAENARGRLLWAGNLIRRRSRTTRPGLPSRWDFAARSVLELPWVSRHSTMSMGGPANCWRRLILATRRDLRSNSGSARAMTKTEKLARSRTSGWC